MSSKLGKDDGPEVGNWLGYTLSDGNAETLGNDDTLGTALGGRLRVGEMDGTTLGVVDGVAGVAAALGVALGKDDGDALGAELGVVGLGAALTLGRVLGWLLGTLLGSPLPPVLDDGMALGSTLGCDDTLGAGIVGVNETLGVPVGSADTVAAALGGLLGRKLGLID